MAIVLARNVHIEGQLQLSVAFCRQFFILSLSCTHSYVSLTTSENLLRYSWENYIKAQAHDIQLIQLSIDRERF